MDLTVINQTSIPDHIVDGQKLKMRLNTMQSAHIPKRTRSSVRVVKCGGLPGVHLCSSQYGTMPFYHI